MGRLHNKVALVTGIGGGMGRAAAIRFAAEGATVVGCDLMREGAEETARLVRESGGKIDCSAPVQLTDPHQSAEWVDAAAERHGGIDILYNNASAPRFGSIETFSVEDWDFTLDNELSLVFYATRAAWPHLKARGGGVVLNMGSIAGLRGVEFMPQSAHGAAKAGVINLTKQLAVEGGPEGIRVVCISPGFISTPGTEGLRADGPKILMDNLARLPLGRIGQPHDVVNAALFLVSDEASWITGVNLIVDGGGSILG